MMLDKTGRVLLMVFGGLVGGYFGYWIGDAAGWSTNADWPWKIGGGTGAILTSMGLAVLGVILMGLILNLRPLLTTRRLLRDGRKATAVIEEVRALGSRFTMGGGYHLVLIRAGIRTDHGPNRPAHGVQWISSADLELLGRGQAVGVRYDPDNPARIAIEGMSELSPTRV